jgi:hypothetical protein
MLDRVAPATPSNAPCDSLPTYRRFPPPPPPLAALFFDLRPASFEEWTQPGGQDLGPAFPSEGTVSVSTSTSSGSVQRFAGKSQFGATGGRGC